MSFDLNNSLDFAKATNSLAGNTLLQLQNILDRARGVRQWVIQESSFEGVRFHVFKDKADFSAGLSSVQDQGGRRKTVYKFLYTDGQSTDDQGRDGYVWTFDAIIHGNNYMAAYKQLIELLENRTQPGDLIHPVRGRVRAVPKSWQVTHESSSRRAVILRLEFIEHSFNIGEIELQSDKGPGQGVLKNSITNALAYIAKIGTIIDKVRAISNVATSFVNTVERDVAAVQESLRSNLQSVNASFNTDGSTDLPGALPINSGGSTTTDPTSSTGTASTVSVVASPNDPFLGTRGTTTNVAALSTQEVIDNANTYRQLVDTMIDNIVAGGQELELYDEIQILLGSAVALQDAVEAGIQSSKPKIIEYTTTREMSVREIAFANGLSPEDGYQIDQLNPTLDSLNAIAEGTTLLIPVSTV